MLQRLLGTIVHLFFRRVAVVGADNVPATGPLLLVLNHPNALVDPVLLLVLSPRPVKFLAKEPLFRMPVVGTVVRGLGSIPVHRRQDHADMTRNRETFSRVWDELSRGGAVALFPEGTSHDDPALRPFKTGAARLALGATAMAGGAAVAIVPAGLYYTAKRRFRSSVLLSFGQPIAVPAVGLGRDGEPAAEPVRQLTARLEHAMTDVTLQADHHDALRLVTRAERIFSSAAGERPALADQFALRQRFVAGYAELRRRDPAAVDAVEHELARYEAELADAGIAPEHVASGPIAPRRVLRYTLRSISLVVLLAPPALVGVALHFPAYQFIDFIAARFGARSPDVEATVKIVAGMVWYPATWVLVGALAWHWWGLWPGVAALLLGPITGAAALRVIERLDRFIGGVRALRLILFRPSAYRRLLARRARIRDDILRLAEQLPGA